MIGIVLAVIPTGLLDLFWCHSSAHPQGILPSRCFLVLLKLMLALRYLASHMQAEARLQRPC